MRSDARRRTRAAAVLPVLLAGSLLAGCGGALPPGAAAGCGPAWTAAWHAAEQSVPGDQLTGRTLRMAVHPQASGGQVRLRLSNRYGDGPLRIGAVSLGSGGAGAAVVAPVRLSVDGRADTTVPAGGEVLTDPVPVTVTRGAPLVVSLYLAEVPVTISSHPVAMRTAWLSRPGDRTGQTGPDGFDTTLQSWPVLAGVDVLGTRPDAALLVIGDSLVDGVGSTPDGDDRLPDQIAARLGAMGGDRVMTVLNAGLSRNQLLQDDPPAGGDAPLTRFGVDVEPVEGVRDVLLLVGTNDLVAGATPDALIGGLRAFADRAHAAGLRVFLTTIPPSTSGGRGSPAVVATRDRVNGWIRSEGPRHADGVVDAAAALADPNNPLRLRSGYDSGDGLHPSAEGYRAVAESVPVADLSGSPCRDQAIGGSAVP